MATTAAPPAVLYGKVASNEDGVAHVSYVYLGVTYITIT